LFKELGKPTRCFLLGADGVLYLYNNLNHQLNPFSQKAKNIAVKDGERIKYIIEHSVIEYENGTTERKEGYDR